jgi:hypothetical protein
MKFYFPIDVRVCRFEWSVWLSYYQTYEIEQTIMVMVVP